MMMKKVMISANVLKTLERELALLNQVFGGAITPEEILEMRATPIGIRQRPKTPSPLQSSSGRTF